MKRSHDDAKGREVEEKLDDVTPPEGGGGGPRKVGPNDSFMETWDVVQAPHPARGKPLPDEDEDEKWGGS
ncbi:MAG: hypothetical protein JWM80_3056 [Cyanobacteria bacterium RYN_339]|nr:hypothetical protein [Cyanobacteria bacterium RYN_339]